MKLTKLFKGLFLFLFLLIVALIAIPYFFKDQLVERLKSDINKSVDARVDFADVSLSLFRSFPDFSLRLDDFSITGKAPFEGLELARASRVDLDLNLMSVIQSDAPIQIHSIELLRPHVHLMVLNDGQANYNIVAMPESTAEEPNSEGYDFMIKLKKFTIDEGSFVYDDRQGNYFVELQKVQHRGKGDFTQDIFDLVTHTTIEETTARIGGIRYLKKAKADLDITFVADIPNSKFTLKDNTLQVNALTLHTDGFIQTVQDGVDIQIDFKAPSNEFKHFLSLIPSAYKSDFDQIKTTGQLQFDGEVKGIYAENRLPGFRVNLNIDNGQFQYPDLPMGMDNIESTILINSPGSDLDDMVVDVSKFGFNLGSNPMTGYLKLRKPISDPDIDTELKGVLNLADLAKAYPMEDVSAFTGTLRADVRAKTRLSTIEKGDYEQVDMDGVVQLNRINYRAEGIPPILVDELSMSFTPKKVLVNKFSSKLGKSDLRASGHLDNILALISPEKTMTGQLEVASNYFNANEWITQGEPASSNTTPPPTAEQPTEVFDQFDLDVIARFNNIDYDIYKIRNTVFDGRVSPNKIRINEAVTKIGDSDLKATGNLNNVFAYLYDNENLHGRLAVSSRYFDLNQFMVEEPSNSGTPKAQNISETQSGVILLPERMDLELDANMRKVQYTNLTLSQLKGTVALKDEVASLDNCSANLLGGSMNLSGTYSTVNPMAPEYEMDYAVKKFDFQKAFNYLNTFRQLAPVGKYLEGHFNTNIKLKGKLNDQMYPMLDALTADGFLQTINGTLKNFAPLEKVGKLLNLSAFNSLNLRDTKNWIEIEDGKVLLKNFDYKYKDIDMVIGGTHGLNQEMNYTILAKIPRKMWENNAAGKAAGKGLDFLKGEAGKLGVNLNTGDFIDVQINLLGSISDPKVNIKPLGSGGKSLKETAKEVVEQTIDKAKEEATKKINEKKEEVAKQVKDKQKELENKAAAEVKKIMDEARKNANKITREAKRVSDRTRKEGYKQADNLLGEAGSNPLKKLAAKKSADILKKETDKKADQIINEGNRRADQVMKKAEDQADRVRKKYLGG